MQMFSTGFLLYVCVVWSWHMCATYFSIYHLAFRCYISSQSCSTPKLPFFKLKYMYVYTEMHATLHPQSAIWFIQFLLFPFVSSRVAKPNSCSCLLSLLDKKKSTLKLMYKNVIYVWLIVIIMVHFFIWWST